MENNPICNYINGLKEKRKNNQKRFFNILLEKNIDLFNIDKVIFKVRFNSTIEMDIQRKDNSSITNICYDDNSLSLFSTNVKSFIENGPNCLEDFGFSVKNETTVEKIKLKRLFFFTYYKDLPLEVYTIDVSTFNSDIE